MQYLKIGEIIKSQGLKGDLIVKLEHELDSNVSTLFVETGLIKEESENDYKIAYKVEKFLKIDSENILIKFREIGDRSQASYLKNKGIFIENERVVPNINSKN